MSRLPAKEVRLEQVLDLAYRSWPARDKFRKWIDDMKLVLKENALAGNKIQKDRIPNYYVRKFGVHNLYRYGHPEGFRSCYTLLNDGAGLSVVVLDLMNHTE